jgi:hypothetical protein
MSWLELNLMRITLLKFASTLLGSGSAWAGLEVLQTGIQMETVEEPVRRETGSVWRGLMNGKPYAVTYVRVSESSETLEDSEGCSWTRPRTFYSPSTEWTNCRGRDGSATVSLKWPIFPFHVGKAWAFNVDAGQWRTSRECKVEDTARVKIGAGEYDTFRIVCNDRWNTRTRYYSPDLGTSVFLERVHRKKGLHITYEFIRNE